MSRSKEHKGPDPDVPVKRNTLISFQQFVWNTQTRKFCGRGAASWGAICLYYVVFYIGLSLFFAGMLYIFLLSLDDNRPSDNYYDNGYRHAFMSQPGMGFKPAADRDEWRYTSPKIKFKTTDSSTYHEYISELSDFLAGYNTNDALTTCNGSSTTHCRLTRNSLGACDGRADATFGYSSGEPCVLLKMNKIIGWSPVPFDANPDTTQIEQWNSSHVPVTCEQDINNTEDMECEDCLGSPEILPSLGFPVSCFPYCGTAVLYTTPAVMVKFRNIGVGQEIAIYCKAWARNLIHDRIDKAASVRFTIFIEQ